MKHTENKVSSSVFDIGKYRSTWNLTVLAIHTNESDRDRNSTSKAPTTTTTITHWVYCFISIVKDFDFSSLYFPKISFSILFFQLSSLSNSDLKLQIRLKFNIGFYFRRIKFFYQCDHNQKNFIMILTSIYSIFILQRINNICLFYFEI